MASTPVALRTRSRLKRKASLPPLAHQAISSQLAQTCTIAEPTGCCPAVLAKSPKTSGTIDIKENVNRTQQQSFRKSGIELRTGAIHTLTALAPVLVNRPPQDNSPRKHCKQGMAAPIITNSHDAPQDSPVSSTPTSPSSAASAEDDSKTTGNIDKQTTPNIESEICEPVNTCNTEMNGNSKALDVQGNSLTDNQDDKWNKTSMESPDDGVATGDEPIVVVIESDALEALQHPLEILNDSISKLDQQDCDWLTRYQATEALRKVCVCHSKLLENDHCSKFVEVFCDEASSLRSAQCRNGLLAMKDLFASPHPKFDYTNRLDKVLEVLLVKSFHDLKFIANTAVAALSQLVEKHATPELLHALAKWADSKSNKVCSEVAKCAIKCAKKLEKHDVMVLGLDADIVKAVALLESGKSVEARKPAQSLLKLFFQTVGQSKFENFVKETLPGTQVVRVLKLNTQKPSSKSGNPKKSLRELMMEKRKAMMAAKQGNNSEPSVEVVT